MNSYTKEQLESLCQDSYSYSDVLRKLGIQPIGSNFVTIKKYIEKYEIDISHFTHRGWRKNKQGEDVAIVPLEEICKENTHFQCNQLKKRLIAANIFKNECACCGLTNEWQGKPITLELHHKNGNHFDNRIENLQILCPNCHSQTDTFRTRNKPKQQQVTKPYNVKRIPVKKCLYCGKEFKPSKNVQKYCSQECYAKSRPIIEPKLKFSKDELQKLINEGNNITQMAVKLNSHRVTIREYLMKYGLYPIK